MNVYRVLFILHHVSLPQKSPVRLAEHRWVSSSCARERIPKISEVYFNEEKVEMELLSKRVYAVVLDVVLGLGQVGTRD